MSKIILVTGGARSGKSNFAEKLCFDRNNNTAYIATSIPFDDEMKDRVKKHQENRPRNWNTYEIYEDIYSIIKEIYKEHETVILDCVTLLVNNLMFEHNLNIEESSQEEKTNLYFVFVTNELGMGIVPGNKLSRIYADIVGRINQYIASKSNEVYFVVSGIAMKIKE